MSQHAPHDMVQDLTVVGPLSARGRNAWLGVVDGRQVVVRFVDRAPGEADVARFERFKRFVRSTTMPRCSHIARTLDHGLTPTHTPFVITEWRDGETLAHGLSEKGPQALGQARTLFAQIAKTLASLHRRGHIHGNLHAGSVLLSPTQPLFVTLLEVGLAQVAPSNEEIGTVPSLEQTTMSPARLTGAPADEQDDLWAFAVLAYQAITGRLPFSRRSLAAQLVSIHEGRVAPLELPGLSPETHAALTAWFGKALSLDPKARFRTIAEMNAGWLEATHEHAEPYGAADAPPASGVRVIGGRDVAGFDTWTQFEACVESTVIDGVARRDGGHVTKAPHGAAATAVN